jgi:outer membrane protein
VEPIDISKHPTIDSEEEEMPRTAVFLVLACALPWAATFFGCASKDAYRYETIKTEYADLACNLSKQQAADTPPATCAVNSNLTLQDVLDIARDNNPDLLMAMARIERARAMLEKSAAPFYPQVNVYTEYLQGDAPSAYLFKTIDQRKLPPGTDFNDPGWFENYESGVSAGINLFNGGRDGLNREMAKTGLTISQLDRDGIENQVMATAIGAYYDVLAAANFTTVAKESVETTRSQLRIMDVRFQAGGALKTDLLSLRVRMAETEEILVQSRNRQRLAKAALAEILGVEPDIPFGVVEAEARAIDVPDDPLPPGLRPGPSARTGQRPRTAAPLENGRGCGPGRLPAPGGFHGPLLRRRPRDEIQHRPGQLDRRPLPELEGL